MNVDGPTPRAGQIYADLVVRELEAERGRRAALDDRAISTITTSGGFATVNFAVAAVITQSDAFRPSGAVIGLLVASILTLAGSALVSLFANRLAFYEVIAPAQMRRWTGDEYWLDDGDNAQWLVTHADSRTIGSLRAGNALKATRLEAALWLQLAAFGFISAAVVTILIRPA